MYIFLFWVKKVKITKIKGVRRVEGIKRDRGIKKGVFYGKRHFFQFFYFHSMKEYILLPTIKSDAFPSPLFLVNIPPIPPHFLYPFVFVHFLVCSFFSHHFSFVEIPLVTHLSFF